MACLSVPILGNWFLDNFGKHMLFRLFFEFWNPTFFKKHDLRWLLWPKRQVKKVSYIDRLVMRFSPKSEFVIEPFNYFSVFMFSFL